MSQIVLTSDTLVTTPTAGALEYSSPVIYATTVGTQRGVMPNAQFYRLDANYAGLNATGAQGVFGVGTGGTGIGVTLSASTVYAFETTVMLSKSAGATSHTIGMGFGGTATVNNILYYLSAQDQAAAGVVGTAGGATTGVFLSVINTASNTTFTQAIAAAARSVPYTLKGTVSVNAGGTFVPQYTLSAAPGGAYSTVAGSYFLIYPIGSAGVINVGTWS